ncbi:MAG: hypothetical protein ACI4RD_05210 [Kiritimatiellia bacterium]
MAQMLVVVAAGLAGVAQAAAPSVQDVRGERLGSRRMRFSYCVLRGRAGGRDGLVRDQPGRFGLGCLRDGAGGEPGIFVIIPSAAIPRPTGKEGSCHGN